MSCLWIVGAGVAAILAFLVWAIRQIVKHESMETPEGWPKYGSTKDGRGGPYR